MPPTHHFHAIIVAAGQGERSGLPIPKQFAMLNGHSVLWWSANAMAKHSKCAAITIVCAAGETARVEQALAGITAAVVDGGATRQASVSHGLSLVDQSATPFVIIHDAARPGVDAATIDQLLIAMEDDHIGGAIPGWPVGDTLAHGDDDLGDVVDRSGLVRVQTPQIFVAQHLIAAHAAWVGNPATDDAQMVRQLGLPVAITPGHRKLDKITYPGDLDGMKASTTIMPASAVMQQAPVSLTRTAVGMGYDVHRLIAGDGIWLGGVFIPHDRSLEGHSDADVVLHAITDAVLGAIGAGDIGEHFPPSDPQWRGAASDRFLSHACQLVRERGGVVEHVDCTIICEEPKVGPHRSVIVDRIMAIMQLPAGCVSVKATTTEKLGFTGRGEGMGAQAVATVAMPRKETGTQMQTPSGASS